jgi:hypothetical protein
MFDIDHHIYKLIAAKNPGILSVFVSSAILFLNLLLLSLALSSPFIIMFYIAIFLDSL